MSKPSREDMEELARRFPFKKKSWMARCVKRLPTVRQIAKNVWFLRCLPQLGDKRAYYIVVLDEDKKVYTCTCYDEAAQWGAVRRRNVCSHVGAVVLYRIMVQRRLEG